MTQTNKTAIICFRAHKNLKSWLVYAGQGFPGGKSELLRVIVMKATMEQPHNSGLGPILGRIMGNSRQPSIGGTAVYAVRLPMDIITSAKDAAANQHQGISEFYSKALYAWLESFKPRYESNKENTEDWVTDYATSYRARAEELANVYAQKADKEVEKTTVRQG